MNKTINEIIMDNIYGIGASATLVAVAAITVGSGMLTPKSDVSDLLQPSGPMITPYRDAAVAFGEELGDGVRKTFSVNGLTYEVINPVGEEHLELTVRGFQNDGIQGNDDIASVTYQTRSGDIHYSVQRIKRLKGADMDFTEEFYLLPVRAGIKAAFINDIRAVDGTYEGPEQKLMSSLADYEAEGIFLDATFDPNKGIQNVGIRGTEAEVLARSALRRK